MIKLTHSLLCYVCIHGDDLWLNIDVGGHQTYKTHYYIVVGLINKMINSK